MENINNIVNRLKKDTNNAVDMTYREKNVCKKKVQIIYIESLTGSDKISDFIIRSLDRIDKTNKDKDLLKAITNGIDNFKYSKITTYEDICYYLNYGFTVILIEGIDTYLALETKRNLARSVATPQTENSLRGAMDSFVEDMQTNLGLVRKRIKDNDLWIKSNEVGRHTKTKVNILYINKICKEEYVNLVDEKIKSIDIDGVTNSGTIKNLIQKENKSVFPTIISTERPDRVSQALLAGKIVILVDMSPFALIIPTCINDFLLAVEDSYSKSINISLTRIVRYVGFFITLFTPALYIAVTTYNQEMLPTELLISFASQRSTVPFPAFFEAIIMMASFEILRECDLRMPTFSTSALSIVGALILGEAAVNAGIVSPIMIIVIAITAVSALLFTEPEIINGIRWYRLLFMLGANFLGIFGVVAAFIYFIVKLASLESFGFPFLYPLSPTSSVGLKNSFIKFPTKSLTQRETLLSKNKTKLRGGEE